MKKKNIQKGVVVQHKKFKCVGIILSQGTHPDSVIVNWPNFGGPDLLDRKDLKLWQSES